MLKCLAIARSASYTLFIKKLARENAGWGYRRIVGELRKLRLRVGRSTVQRILRNAGLTPSTTRRELAGETVWRKFIRLHINTLVACNFFTKTVISPLGSRLAFVLVFIHAGKIRIFLSPATYNPHGGWVEQQARNVMMWMDDHNIRARFILHDRDAKFSGAFDRLFQDGGFQPIRTPRLAPDANDFAESWIASFKRDCLNHFSSFSLGHLDHIGQQYARLHNINRPHQGLGNRTVEQVATGPPNDDVKTATPDLRPIRCRRFLDGLLRHYYRAA